MNFVILLQESIHSLKSIDHVSFFSKRGCFLQKKALFAAYEGIDGEPLLHACSIPGISGNNARRVRPKPRYSFTLALWAFSGVFVLCEI